MNVLRLQSGKTRANSDLPQGVDIEVVRMHAAVKEPTVCIAANLEQYVAGVGRAQQQVSARRQQCSYVAKKRDWIRHVLDYTEADGKIDLALPAFIRALDIREDLMPTRTK